MKLSEEDNQIIETLKYLYPLMTEQELEQVNNWLKGDEIHKQFTIWQDEFVKPFFVQLNASTANNWRKLHGLPMRRRSRRKPRGILKWYNLKKWKQIRKKYKAKAVKPIASKKSKQTPHIIIFDELHEIKQ